LHETLNISPFSSGGFMKHKTTSAQMCMNEWLNWVEPCNQCIKCIIRRHSISSSVSYLQIPRILIPLICTNADCFFCNCVYARRQCYSHLWPDALLSLCAWQRGKIKVMGSILSGSILEQCTEFIIRHPLYRARFCCVPGSTPVE
jgi:hypothetical protein